MLNFKTYEEFKDFVKLELTIFENGKHYDLSKLNELQIYSNMPFNYKFDNKSDYIVEEYSRGGQSGASCYDTEIYYFNSESPDKSTFKYLCELIYNNEKDAKFDIIDSDFLLEIHIDDEPDYYYNYHNMGYIVLDLKYYYNNCLSLKELRRKKIDEIDLL